MNDYPEKREIGPVIFRWRFGGIGRGYIEVEWLGHIIAQAPLPLPDKQNPLHFFSQPDPQNPMRAVNGEMHYTASSKSLLVTRLEYPDGEARNELLFGGDSPGPRPPVPLPPDSEPAETGVIVERPPESDLFPYLYLAQWPGITATELENRFVQYDTGSAPKNSFYEKLVEARQQGRGAMVDQADLFLAEKAPYTGRYLRTIDALGVPMDRLPSLNEGFRRSPPVDLAEFKQRTEVALEMSWSDIGEYWLGEIFSGQMERCWQNLMALNVQPGFNRQLGDQLLATLALATLIARIVASEPEPPEGDADGEALPPEPALLWPAERLGEGIRATVVLPGTVFPLPSAKESARGGAGDTGPVPYAIGDLKLVRQRLRGYCLGEVSGIENVMRGEYKESSERRLRESRVEELESDSGLQQVDRELSGQRQDLLAEALNTLEENFQYHYESQYGPPAKQLTVIVDGTVQPVDGKPQKTATSDATRAARLLTQRAAGSLARRLHWQRSSASIDRDERCTVRRVDASGMDNNLRAIYRWVNKIYQCWTVTLGKRFILEFLVRNPSQGYISGSFSLRGLSLREPPPLIDFDVKNFQDISVDPKSPAYYANLAAEYDVVDIQPPPAPRVISSAAFQGGEPVCRQSIPVAPGYRAVSANVTVSPAPGDDSLKLCVSVGQQSYEYPGGETETAQLKLSGQTGQVPAAVLVSTPKKSLKTPAGYSVAVEIEAELGEQALDEWKLATFKAISAGCTRQRERYYEMVGSWPSRVYQPSPLGAREAVRDELRRDIVRQLIRHVEKLTGESGNIALGGQRYVQFLERALAWEEMAYAFTVKTEDDVGTAISQQYRGEDELFSAFLQAGLARVLLPVTPDFAFRMLYFLASGQIWPGADTLAPVFCPQEEGTLDYRYVNLANALKESSEAGAEEERGESWELVVPTDMTVLQEGDELPVFTGEMP
ncbi:hypothetical protein [Microbulbifer sp.]|uniref:hypothetical protein n=1 Tax=Microbulbifer sp. TaxID=1908541 RepID=UPI003F3BA9F0